MRESRLSGSVEGVLRNPDPYSDPVGTESNDQTYLKRAPFYNAFIRTYPVHVEVGDHFRVRRNRTSAVPGLHFSD